MSTTPIRKNVDFVRSFKDIFLGALILCANSSKYWNKWINSVRRPAQTFVLESILSADQLKPSFSNLARTVDHYCIGRRTKRNNKNLVTMPTMVI
jgi:hypothetical protein